MDEATLFKFGKWVEYGRVHPRGEKFPLKGAWSKSRDHFQNFTPPPSIFLEWMKIYSLNLASKSTTVSPTPGVKNFPSKGRGLGHVTLFEILNPFNISGMDEATLFKFGNCIEYGKSHLKGKKFPLKGAWSESRDPCKN